MIRLLPASSEYFLFLQRIGKWDALIYSHVRQNSMEHLVSLDIDRVSGALTFYLLPKWYQIQIFCFAFFICSLLVVSLPALSWSFSLWMQSTFVSLHKGCWTHNQRVCHPHTRFKQQRLCFQEQFGALAKELFNTISAGFGDKTIDPLFREWKSTNWARDARECKIKRKVKSTLTSESWKPRQTQEDIERYFQ